MLTVGVDLAAQPNGTAIAYLDGLRAVRACAVLLPAPTTRRSWRRVRQADKVGIDCPLGWPVPFVEFVTAHQRGTVSIAPDCLGGTGVAAWPTASPDVAIRAAGLLARLAADGQPVDRTGIGVVVEVYPPRRCDAGNSHTKGSRAPRTSPRSVSWPTACRRRPHGWTSPGTKRSSDHALDAVVAALTARAAAQGLVTGPDIDQLDTARSEGWVALPTSPISDLRE